jgi:hypothetical protein
MFQQSIRFSIAANAIHKEVSTMINPFLLIKGVGLGAGMMYFFDPASGNRRRSLIRDQLVHACTVSNKTAGVVYRDASNRLQGVKTELHSLVEPSEAGIVERVQEGASELTKTLGIRRNTWSPTARAAATLAGCGFLASLMNKRDLAALALGAAGLAFYTKEVTDQQLARQGGRQNLRTGEARQKNSEEESSDSKNSTADSNELNEGANRKRNVPTDKHVVS